MHLTVGGKELRGDAVLAMTLRSDLAPIPQTLEATVRYDDKLAPLLKEGKIVTAGIDNSDYLIVKSVPAISKEGEQAGRPLGAISITALQDRTAQVGFRRRTAVVKEKVGLADIYSACGAKVRVESDFKVDRFSCLVGSFPTIGIAALLQEEGGAIYWTGKSLKFVRLADLMRGAALADVPVNAVTTLESGFLERHEIPWFYSVGDDGALVQGNRDKARAVEYTPKKNNQVLRNMTRCLVQRHTLKGIYRPDINAGAIINVGDEPHAVITAAHVIGKGTDGGSPIAFSKFWLGTLEE